jgi:hypothetical protein
MRCGTPRINLVCTPQYEILYYLNANRTVDKQHSRVLIYFSNMNASFKVMTCVALCAFLSIDPQASLNLLYRLHAPHHTLAFRWYMVSWHVWLSLKDSHTRYHEACSTRLSLHSYRRRKGEAIGSLVYNHQLHYRVPALS